jgi:flavin reductase (DIM6/NTAB) family NADH-FMN oxidoreductase RutF
MAKSAMVCSTYILICCERDLLPCPRRFRFIVQPFFRFRQGGHLRNLPKWESSLDDKINEAVYRERYMNVSQLSQIWAEVDPVVWLVTSRYGNASGGLIATFVNQASIVPDCPRMVIGLSRQHHTTSLVDKSGAFALHVVDEQHVDWVWRFGLQSGWKLDKLQGIDHQVRATGSPILMEARGWLDCHVEAHLDTGDRTLYLAEVLDAHYHAGSPILTVQQLLQLTPPNKLQLLNELHKRDEAVDAQAIRKWRSQRDVQSGKSNGEPR